MGLLFFGREELPITQSALLPLFDRCDAHPIDRPRDRDGAHRERDRARLPREPQRHGSSVRGRTAHTARPWLGRNAIHTAIGALAPIADLAPNDVEIDGLVFREVVSVTTIEGGIAGNVVPDRVEATVNFRYAPTRTPAEAEARLRELLAIERCRAQR